MAIFCNKNKWSMKKENVGYIVMDIKNDKTMLFTV